MSPEGARWRARVPCALALTLGALALVCAGCDMIFGINAGVPRPDAGAPQGEAGAPPGDAGADGGDASAPGADGGVDDCTKDLGEGSVTLTDIGGANIESMMFDAKEGVTVFYDAIEQVTAVSISGGTVPLHCDVELLIEFAGSLSVGKTYYPVSALTRFGPYFLDDDNVFVVLFADLDCLPPASKRWEPMNGFVGSVTVDSIASGKVQISLQGLNLLGVQDGKYDGQGTVRVDGTAQAPCFEGSP